MAAGTEREGGGIVGEKAEAAAMLLLLLLPLASPESSSSSVVAVSGATLAVLRITAAVVSGFSEAVVVLMEVVDFTPVVVSVDFSAVVGVNGAGVGEKCTAGASSFRLRSSFFLAAVGK